MVPWKSMKDLTHNDSMEVATRGRCIRKYKTTMYNKPNEVLSLDAIFEDEEVLMVIVFQYLCIMSYKSISWHSICSQGTKMLCTIPNNFIKKFENSFEEGGIYAIMGFVVTNYSTLYKMTDDVYKLKFTYKTLIRAGNEIQFPNHVLKFKSFAEIKALSNPVAEIPFG